MLDLCGACLGRRGLGAITVSCYHCSYYNNPLLYLKVILRAKGS